MNLSEAIEKARLCEGNPPPNESCTCDWVIVPILHSLGYDHFDIVSRGADNQNQFPDYTILKGTSCEWFLEAKAWSVHLADNHAGQALNYANQNGRRWVVLSNGKEWRLYDNDIRGTSAEKLVAMARLSNDEEIRPFLDSISKDSVTSGRLEVQAQGFRLASTLNAQMKDADSDVVKAIAKALRSKGLSVKTGDVVGWFAGRSRTPHVPDTLPFDERASMITERTVGYRIPNSDTKNPRGHNVIGCDTVVCPAREDGFRKVFLGENAWYAVLLSGSVIPNLRYIAAYRPHPIGAITHVARIDSIEPYQDTGKHIIYFAEPATAIDPIPLVPHGKRKAPQARQYTTYERLMSAKTLDDVFL